MSVDPTDEQPPRPAPPKRVLIESPFAGETPADEERNKRYLEACIRDCCLRGEAPFASHKMYTVALDDTDPEERELGIKAGFVYRETTELSAVYVDLGVSKGMQWGIEHALETSHPVEHRTLGPEWEAEWELVRLKRSTKSLKKSLGSNGNLKEVAIVMAVMLVLVLLGVILNQ